MPIRNDYERYAIYMLEDMQVCWLHSSPLASLISLFSLGTAVPSVNLLVSHVKFIPGAALAGSATSVSIPIAIYFSVVTGKRFIIAIPQLTRLVRYSNRLTQVSQSELI